LFLEIYLPQIQQQEIYLFKVGPRKMDEHVHGFHWGEKKPQPHPVGGFNPCEKYSSKWESSPGRGENKKL